MKTIQLLLAYADRLSANRIETAVLDVCYDRAVVQSTRTSNLEELAHQGSLRDFDLIVISADELFADRKQQAWASAPDIAAVVEAIRAQQNTPIIALTALPQTSQLLLDSGADSILPLPLNPDQIKAELRHLLDFTGIVDEDETQHWYNVGPTLRSLQKDEAFG
jgi:CheY-like chemotaxis protein